MSRTINSVAVLGAGTMGSGIAALCAQGGCNVLLLDMSKAFCDKAVERLQAGRSPALQDAAAAARISTGSFAEDMGRLADCDWICEAIIENPVAKRDLFNKSEAARRDGSIISTNTSGILLSELTEGMPERLRRDIAVTHFFNPVNIMRLLELIPGEDTDPEVIETLAGFLRDNLGKGVVYAKDTINFIGNRVGCYAILAGLHKAKSALEAGLSMEQVDALMSAPVGLPSTGLYGLVDLIGLDVMDMVGKNMAANLPEGDAGHGIAALPPAEQGMLARGQLGRKTGAGFYRVTKQEDGSKLKEVYDLTTGQWRTAARVELDEAHSSLGSLLFADDMQGRFAWDLMSAAICYSADLIPEISDDVVNVDRAMRWGFNWQRGPFELLDALGPQAVAERLQAEGRPLPRMLLVLREAGADTFYRNDGSEHLGLDGAWHKVPAE
jgi:3-hydroxyacyl-CoA dehydrogenase